MTNELLGCDKKTVNGWTVERRAKQSAMIQQWQPWTKSTGPRTEEGKAIASQNAHREIEDMTTIQLIRASARYQREYSRCAKSLINIIKILLLFDQKTGTFSVPKNKKEQQTMEATLKKYGH